MNERKLYTIYKEKLIPIKKAVDTLFKMDLDEEDREILKKGISKMGQLFDKKKIEIVEEPYIIEFIMTVRGIVYKYKMRKNEGNKKNYDLFINVLGRELDEAMDRLGEPQVILKDAEISKFDDIYEFIDEMKESTKYRNGRIGGKVIKQLREYLGDLHNLYKKYSIPEKNYDLFINDLGMELDDAMNRLGEPHMRLGNVEISEFDDIYEFINKIKESAQYKKKRIGGKMIEQLQGYLGDLHDLYINHSIFPADYMRSLEVLGLSEKSSDADVRRTYKKLSIMHKGGRRDKIAEIDDAYDILTNKENRETRKNYLDTQKVPKRVYKKRKVKGQTIKDLQEIISLHKDVNCSDKIGDKVGKVAKQKLRDYKKVVCAPYKLSSKKSQLLDMVEKLQKGIKY